MKKMKIWILVNNFQCNIAASNPLAINSEEIDKEVLEKEQKLIAEELKNSGKTDEIAKK